MHEAELRLAGLRVLVARAGVEDDVAVVFLHGYAMRPTDLSPFAHSLGLAGTRFYFPQGPLRLADGAHAWWPIDEEARAASLRQGPRDLASAAPEGRATARALLCELIAAVRAHGAFKRLLLAGFSQGGMLACDALLMAGLEVDALALLSSSRLALRDWEAHKQRLSGLPAFVSHGRADGDLAFEAGERLAGFLRSGGANVQWVPFDGGHEIPFLVWRRLRSFANRWLPIPRKGRELSYGTP